MAGLRSGRWNEQRWGGASCWQGEDGSGEAEEIEREWDGDGGGGRGPNRPVWRLESSTADSAPPGWRRRLAAGGMLERPTGTANILAVQNRGPPTTWGIPCPLPLWSWSHALWQPVVYSIPNHSHSSRRCGMRRKAEVRTGSGMHSAVARPSSGKYKHGADCRHELSWQQVCSLK